MKWLFKIFIVILYFKFGCTIVEIKYLKGVPRLGNTSFWDYYFSCSTEGLTLQWEVNGDPLGGFLSGEIARVLFSSRPNFDYIASLLSSQEIGNQHSLMSVLIVSLTSQSNLEVVCGNGLLSSRTNNSEDKMNVKDMFKDSISLQNLLIEEISYENLRIFVCGVHTSYLLWQTESRTYPFFESNNIGLDRCSRQQNDTEVILQALFVSRIPYEIVSVLLVTGTLFTYIGCENIDHSLRFDLVDDTSTINTPSSVTVTTSTNKSEITTTEDTTDKITTTEDSTDINVESLRAGVVILAILFTLSIIAVVIVTTILVICFVPFFQWKKKREAISATFPVKYINLNEEETKEEKHQPEDDFAHSEEPTEKDFQIQDLKLLHDKQDRLGVCENVNFIISVIDKNVFHVATNISKAPNEGDIYAGMIGNHKVGLVFNSNGDECLLQLTNAIDTYFQEAKYVIVIGLCFTLGSKKILPADVLISKKIVILGSIKEGNDMHIYKRKLLINNELKHIFCDKPHDFEGIIVDKERRAQHVVGRMASGPDLYQNRDLKNLALGADCIGAENFVEKIENLQKKGKSIIAIKAVIQPDDKEGNHWQVYGARAAMYYVIKKITNYKENSHDTSSISQQEITLLTRK